MLALGPQEIQVAISLPNTMDNTKNDPLQTISQKFGQNLETAVQ